LISLLAIRSVRTSGTIVSDVRYAKRLQIFQPFVPEVRQMVYEHFEGSGREDGASSRV
jgi:hypothetical protein